MRPMCHHRHHLVTTTVTTAKRSADKGCHHRHHLSLPPRVYAHLRARRDARAHTHTPIPEVKVVVTVVTVVTKLIAKAFSVTTLCHHLSSAESHAGTRRKSRGCPKFLRVLPTPSQRGCAEPLNFRRETGAQKGSQVRRERVSAAREWACDFTAQAMAVLA